MANHFKGFEGAMHQKYEGVQVEPPVLNFIRADQGSSEQEAGEKSVPR